MLNSPTVREAFSHESFFLEVVVASKVTDTILIIGALAMLIIGGLAYSGVFTSMSQANTLYLSYGMFVGAAFCVVAEAAKVIFQLVRAYYLRSREVTPEELKYKMEQIKKIVFAAKCAKTFPCQHTCTITFKNGKKMDSGIKGGAAYVLIDAVGSDKCFFEDKGPFGTPEQHFSSYAHRAEDLTLEQVLKRLFFVGSILT